VLYGVSATKWETQIFSTIAYLACHCLVEVIPFVDNHKDLLQFAHGFAHKKSLRGQRCSWLRSEGRQGTRAGVPWVRRASSVALSQAV
jgi:hypothetical protein